MMRRPGIFVAIAFAAGAFLGLGASSLFLDIDSLDLRAATEAQLAEESGPLATIAAEIASDRRLFEGAADEIRSRQMRNVATAGVIATAGAVALGVGFSRLDRADAPPTNPSGGRRKRTG